MEKRRVVTEFGEDETGDNTASTVGDERDGDDQ